MMLKSVFIFASRRLSEINGYQEEDENERPSAATACMLLFCISRMFNVLEKGEEITLCFDSTRIAFC